MTPSLPTLSNASAISSPISVSCAEIVATCAMLLCSSTSRADSSSALGDGLDGRVDAALERDRVGAGRDVRRPSWTIAWASTVAVVVPSPATSLVLVATSLASWAPRFSYGSSSSISRAMVTPSLVMVGAPNFLSMTTLRPLRAERHLDGVGERVDAALERAAGVLVELQDLGHDCQMSLLNLRLRVQ